MITCNCTLNRYDFASFGQHWLRRTCFICISRCNTRFHHTIMKNRICKSIRRQFFPAKYFSSRKYRERWRDAAWKFQAEIHCKRKLVKRIDFHAHTFGSRSRYYLYTELTLIVNTICYAYIFALLDFHIVLTWGRKR